MPATEATPPARPISMLRVTTYRTAGPGTSSSAMAVARKTAYVESEGTSRNVQRRNRAGRLRDPRPQLHGLEDFEVRAEPDQLALRAAEALEGHGADALRAAHRHLHAWPALFERARPLVPVRRQLEAVRPRARLLEGAYGGDARDAVHPHPGHPVRDEIPSSCLEHEPERVDRALDDAVALAVADPHPAAAPDGGCQLRQVGNAVLGAEPAARVQVEESLRPRGPLLELGRERREQLQPGGGELAAEPELGRRARHPGGEERLRLVARQAGQPRAVAAREAVAARGPPQRLDRHARGRERLDVAVHGADGHLQPLGDVGRSQLPAGLQEEQEGDETSGAHDCS